MSTPNNTKMYAMAALGGAGLLYLLFFQKPVEVKPNPHIYDPKILFTIAMRQGNDPTGATRYWQNRFRDPTYVKGESIHYSAEAIKADKDWQDTYQKY